MKYHIIENTEITKREGIYSRNKDRFEIYDENDRLICKAHYWPEKKTGKDWINLPKNNETGREYINLEDIDKEFDQKPASAHRTLATSWKDRLTEEEKIEYNRCEKRMAELKEIAMNRPIKELTEEEKIMREIEKLKAKLAKING